MLSYKRTVYPLLNKTTLFRPNKAFNNQLRMVSAITSNEQFTDAISNGTTLVDFFAEWCGPCKMISPVLDKLEPQYESIKFVKVDIDNLSDIAKKYEITAVPSFVFFKDGEVVDVVRGAAAAQVKQALDKLKA